MSSTPQSILAAAKPCVMVMHPHLDLVAAQLEADYTVLRAWLAPTPSKLDAVRAVVVADPVPPFASPELAALSR